MQLVTQIPSNGLTWAVKGPIYEVLPSLFFMSAIINMNIQGDVANLISYTIHNTPSLSETLGDHAVILHRESGLPPSRPPTFPSCAPSPL